MKKKKESSYLEKVLNLWGVVIILWSIYRAYFKTGLPIWLDEFIAKPAVFILPVYYFIKKFDKVNFWKGISFKADNYLKEILIGTAIGVTFFALILSQNQGRVGQALSQPTLFLFVISLATGFSEEVLSRGFVLKRLYEKSKNVFTSSFFASILFFFLHVPILFTTSQLGGGLLLRVMITDIVLSLALCFLFIQRKNLIAPILVHAFYTLSLLLII